MINESPLQSVKSNIVVEFDNESQAKIIYESILLEFETAPDYRSSMNLELKDSKIIINIDAEDSTSFRASVNSAIKWIKLSLEINDLTTGTTNLTSEAHRVSFVYEFWSQHKENSGYSYRYFTAYFDVSDFSYFIAWLAGSEFFGKCAERQSGGRTWFLYRWRNAREYLRLGQLHLVGVCDAPVGKQSDSEHLGQR